VPTRQGRNQNAGKFNPNFACARETLGKCLYALHHSVSILTKILWDFGLVDRLSKYAIFIPMKVLCAMEEVENLFFKNVVKY
jgi:hypothetical protein